MGCFIIGTDFGPTSTLAIKAGSEWANKIEEKACLVHVDDLTSKIYSLSALFSSERPAPKVYDFNTWIRKNIDDQLREQLRAAGIDPGKVEVDLKEGDKIEKLLDTIKEKNSSLFFLGSQPHPLLERIFIGSTTEKMAQLCPVPMVIVRDERALAPKKFLFAVDFSVLSYKTVEWIKRLAKAFGAEVYLLHYLTADLETNMLTRPLDDERLEALQDDLEGKKAIAETKIKQIKSDLLWLDIPCESEIHFTPTHNIPNEILKYAQEKDVDFVFLATHSKGNLQRLFLGSVAIKLIRQCDRSIFLMNEIAHI